MRARNLSVVALGCILFLAGVSSVPAPAGADEGAKVRRFALVVGANNGGPDRVQLQFAQSDAQAMARVLTELGGVLPADRLILLDPDVPTFRTGFTRLKTNMLSARKSGQRVEFVFYYSGHSDEKGLLLRGQLVAYPELRALMREQPADVHIAMLDSCASGAMTRMKGGQWRAPFLVDDSTKVEGHAFLTSSSADEVAQESDKVGGSFFTHYMIAGLRGAADSTRDGRVTLNEAYQYAFTETLARTESPRGGPQHPAYDIQLAGAGDLVLTDLRATTSVLILPESLLGRVYIRDSNGHLVAEVSKTQHFAMTLGLEAGQYTVLVDNNGDIRKGQILVAGDGQAVVDLASFEIVRVEEASARGEVRSDNKPDETASNTGNGEEPKNTKTKRSDPSADTGVQTAAGEPFSQEGLLVLPFSASFVPGLTTNANVAERVVNYFSLTVLLDDVYALEGAEFAGIGSFRRGWMSGFQASGVFNWTDGPGRGFQASGVFNYVGGTMKGFQATSIFNQAGEDMYGFQASTAMNWVDRHMIGFQGAIAFNWVRGHSTGFQGAMGFNVASEGISGVQSGTVNVAGGDSTGAQMGVVNYASSLDGLQLGVVNVAGEASGATIGLFNWVGNGMFVPKLWGSDVMPIAGGLRTGTKTFYTELGFGSNHWASQPYYGFYLAMGGHFKLTPWLFIDLDVMNTSLANEGNWNEDLDLMASARLGIGFKPLSWLSIVLGGSANVLVSSVRDHAGIDQPVYSYDWDDNHLRINPGFFVALQFEPQFGAMNQ